MVVILGYGVHAFDTFGVVFLLVLTAIVMAVRWRPSKVDQARRALRGAPVYTLEELNEYKRGRVLGRARALGDTVIAPISHRRCLCYVTTVEDGGIQSSAEPMLREEGGHPFLFEDATGHAMVVPAGAELAVDAIVTRSGPLDGLHPNQEALLRQHGIAPTARGSLRYREMLVPDGAEVVIVGTGVREPDPDAPAGAAAAPYRDGHRVRLRIAGTKTRPLVIASAASAKLD